MQDYTLIAKPSQRCVVFGALVAGVFFAAVGYPEYTLAGPSDITFYFDFMMVAAKMVVGLFLAYAALRNARSVYAIEGRDIICSEGVFFRRTTRVAANRIDNVEISGIGGKTFLGLTDLELDCSGGPEPDLILKNLNGKDLGRFQQAIAKLSGSGLESALPDYARPEQSANLQMRFTF